MSQGAKASPPRSAIVAGPPASPERHAGARPELLHTVLIGALGLLIMGFYLWIYRAKALTVPIGWDTSRYLWRTALFRSVGLSHLQTAVPSSVNADPARPAFPVVMAMLSSLSGVSPFRLAPVLSAVTAAAVGLAAGGFVAAGLRRPAWELAVVTVAVGLSAFVVRLMGPENYQDNLLAAPVFIAAAFAVLMAVRDRKGLLPAILLLGAGGVIHWAFFAFIAVALGLTAAWYLPASWRTVRTRSGRVVDTPVARMAMAVSGAGALAAAAIFGLLHTDVRTPLLRYSEFKKKLRLDLPKYRFPLTLPVAAVGAGSLGSTVRREQGETQERARFVLRFLLAWCVVALAGYLALAVLHLRVPAHRFLAFALAVPVLGGIGLAWIGRTVASWGGRTGRTLATAAVVAALGAAAYFSHAQWFQVRPWIGPENIQVAANSAAYLDAARVSPDRPIVFIVTEKHASSVPLRGHMIRAALPAERIGHAYLYVGAPDAYLAHRPTPGSNGKPIGISARYFATVERTYARRPVALLLRPFNRGEFQRWVASHPETMAAPGVAVVNGPMPARPVPAAPPPVGLFSAWQLGALSVGSLGMLAAVGLGWTLALLGRWLRWLDALALAPAVGIAALVVGGILIDRVGIRLAGAGGVAAPVVIGAAGWVCAAMARRRRRSGTPSPTDTPPA